MGKTLNTIFTPFSYGKKAVHNQIFYFYFFPRLGQFLRREDPQLGVSLHRLARLSRDRSRDRPLRTTDVFSQRDEVGAAEGDQVPGPAKGDGGAPPEVRRGALGGEVPQDEEEGGGGRRRDQQPEVLQARLLSISDAKSRFFFYKKKN